MDFVPLSERKYQCVSDDFAMELYDINMYEPSTYEKQDFVELRIGPCIGTSRKKCASSSKIRTKF